MSIGPYGFVSRGMFVALKSHHEKQGHRRKEQYRADHAVSRFMGSVTCVSYLNQGLSRVLKISVVESRSRRRLVMECKLIASWAAELRIACEKSRANLQNREPVIDLKNLTAISQEGEGVLLGLMNERVKFRCGIFTKYVLNQLSRQRRALSSGNY